MHEKGSGINQGPMRKKGKAPKTETHKGKTDNCEQRRKKLKPDVHKTAAFADWAAAVCGADTQFKRAEAPSWTSFYPVIFHLALFCKHKCWLPSEKGLKMCSPLELGLLTSIGLTIKPLACDETTD